jgi:hypothetical protein
MLSYKKTILAAAIAGAMAIGVRTSLADTITVTNGAAPSIVSGGTFNGDEQFNYVISFSSTASVQLNDGFLVADFGPLAGYSFGSVSGNAPAGSLFTENSVAGGGKTTGGGSATGLNGETLPSSLPGDDEFVAGGGGLTFIPDATSVLDAVFTYNSSTAFNGSGTGSGGSLALTMYSTEQFVSSTGQTIGVDHSGASGVINLEQSSVFVPSPTAVVPLPASSIGGGLLIGLLLVSKARKARLMA